MNLKITLYDDENYTEYAFENELNKELNKVGRNITSIKTNKEKQRLLFRKKEMIIVDVEISGDEIEDPDEFNDIISLAVVNAIDHLSLELYGIE